MRRFLSSLLIASFVFQPVAASAFFETPADLSQGIRNDPTARTFDGQARGRADTTYFSLWMNGVQQGTDWKDGSLDLHMTIDLDAPDQHVKVRLKADIMLLEKTLYVRLNTIEGNVEDELMLINLKMLQKKWMMVPLDQSGIPDLATLEEELQAAGGELSNEFFSLERSPTAAGSHYSIRLTQETEQQLKDLFSGATALRAETNFHGTVDTNMHDQFLSSKLYLSLKADNAELVVQGKGQRKNSPLTLTPPTQTITLDELAKYTNGFDGAWNPLSIRSSIPHPIEEDSLSSDPFNELQRNTDQDILSGRSSSLRTNAMDRYQARQAARVRRALSSSSSAGSYAPVGDIIPVLPANGLSMGESTAAVTMVEIGDYECPFCAQFHANTFPKLKKDYIDTGKVRFVFRNYPLSYHPYANSAAMAVECTRDQGDSLAWQVHDAILEDLSAGFDPTIEHIWDILRSITGLKEASVLTCMDDDVKQSILDQDTKDAVAGGVSGVPSFWILGPSGKAEPIVGAAPYAIFQKVIDAMLK